MTLEQLVSIDYDEKANSFRNDSLNEFYSQKFVNLVKDINDLTIELSFKNQFNSRFSLWGRKNLEHGLSLIRYVIKTVDLKSLIEFGFKRQHLEFLVNTFSKTRNLQDVSKIYFKKRIIFFPRLWKLLLLIVLKMNLIA